MEIITPQDYRNKVRTRWRRSLRPCDACRKRKTRCVTKDGDGDCVHCQLRSSACTFRSSPPERQATTGASSSSGGERAPGLDDPSLQDGQSSSRSISRSRENSRDETQVLVSEMQSPVQSFHSPAETRASGNSSSQYIHQAPSVIVPELVEPDTDPDPLERTLGCSSLLFSELHGLGSDMEPILMRHRPYDIHTHEFSLETHSIRRVLEHDEGQEYPVTFHLAANEKAVNSDSTHALVDAIEACVRPHGQRLLTLFWRHVHPCYPILSKDAFISNHSQSYRNTTAALLGAIYLSAIRWWTYDPELSIHTPPDSALLHRMLRSALPSSYHRPKLCSIQAALLLLQCPPEDPLNPDHTFQWGLTCQALAIGQSLGLHLDATNWTIPRWERNVRKRLSWALFMQDRWTALAYGRPVHIHDDDWTVKDLTPADFSDCECEESAVTPGPGPGPDHHGRSIASTGIEQYMQMVQLTKILSAIYSNFYTARTCLEQDTVALFAKARPLIDMLTNWYHNIPPSLQINIIYPRKLCFHGYLHFSYYGVAITLLRRLIRSTALSPRYIDDRIISDIRHIALQTAQSAISFVTNLRPDHLEAFWYFTSPYLFSLVGSFTTLLLVTSPSSQERHFWQETLNSYLWNLRIMSKSHKPMQYAVNRLEGTILRGLEHALAVNLIEPLNDNVSPMVGNYISNVYECNDFGGWSLAVVDKEAYDLLGGMAVPPDPTMPR
ncbi:fungal-specific transcription factor domain-containing protein [Dactylonectria estremocensis]|uniref:Fungal-specific transcription factor domain-containing protein n=1 Tax=Dactylonectria estremocensis TaxID=1079267 RepID=A0A9P9FFI6_9HYPO|nr:fungal-specific transcription factor domain-containing protein [Dactylonectria estremocensis]